ncbi:MAG: small multidrug export protein [Ruminococcaceae bacterium]|nr:small multidrug export protein [Oscillospiraceae bacterium]
MSEAITTFLQGLGISNELVIFIVSMLPVVELRGAIPLGVVLNTKPLITFCLAVIGNLLPVPFIILCARPVVDFFLRVKYLRPIGNWLENKVRKNSHKITKYKVGGLFLFVAIPLPGTGAWTGALLAALMNMRLKNAFPSIALGVVAAGILMTFGSSAVDWFIALFV